MAELKRTVLVTGASGFIGRQAVPILIERGFDVHCITSDQAHSWGEGPKWHVADIFDCATTGRLVERIGPSHLLHLAWTTAHGRFWTDPVNLQWVESSLSLTRNFASSGGRRLVTAGTCAEYDFSFGVCDEMQTPLVPKTLYGTAKNSLQALLASYSAEVGLSSSWGRIFFPYGPHENPARLVPSVARALIRGEEAPCTSGDQVRDFLHVRDVAGALVALLESDVSGAVNIGSGEGVPVKEIVGRLAREYGREDLIRLGAIPTPSHEPARIVACTRRLRDEVGWTNRIGLERGLAESLQWWKSHVDQSY